VFDRIAETFSIQNWSVTAVKAYLGHSLAAAAGDQLAATFGLWTEGMIPGISTLDKIAAADHQRRIHLFQQHKASRLLKIQLPSLDMKEVLI